MGNGIFSVGAGLLVVMVLSLGRTVAAAPFSFEDYEREEAAEEARGAGSQRRSLNRLLSVDCPPATLTKRIALVITEDHRYRSRYWASREQGYAQMFEQINASLGRLGLRTYTQAQIRAQIERAERGAVAIGDVDAALGAAERLGADLVLNANIRSTVSVNRVYGVEEVSLAMSFDLRTRDGIFVSSLARSGTSLSGTDTFQAANALVRQHADGVAAQLYHDLCVHDSRR